MYRIMTRSSWSQQAEGRIGEFVVTDQPVGYDGDREWPIAATFPVSMRHDQETQQRRAFEYRDYLNKGIVVQPPFRETVGV